MPSTMVTMHEICTQLSGTNLMRDFHDAGLEHGDLTGANFIVPTDQTENITVVDFDWEGSLPGLTAQ
jgi:tRNA A-37 threonylcarbamoyl transferase component Bud32